MAMARLPTAGCRGTGTGRREAVRADWRGTHRRGGSMVWFPLGANGKGSPR